jgi:hypothetical protein
MSKYVFEVEQIGDVNGEARATITVSKDGEPAPLHVDTLNLYSSLSRNRFCKELCDRAHDAEAGDEAGHELLAIAGRLKAAADRKGAAPRAETELLAAMPEDVRKDAEGMLLDPSLIQEIGDDIERMGVVGDRDVAMGVYLIGTSRLSPKPLAGIVKGASSSGKSHVISTTAKLFPSETKLEAHQISPTALYYLPEDALRHRFVVAGERPRNQSDDQANATKPLREMLSDGVLRYVVTQKVGDELIATPFEKRGPIAFVESTSASTIFAEDANRCLILHADESPEQTARIISAAAARAAIHPIDAEALIVPVHHALQRMLKPLRVLIPFAPYLASSFPKQRVEARRAMPHLLNTIRSVALLRQFQKAVTDGTISADAEDYRVALRIVRASIDQLRGGVGEQVKRVWAAIEKNAEPDKDFTRLEVAKWAGMRPSDSNSRIRILIERGFLQETAEAKGNRPGRFKIDNDQIDSRHLDINGLEDSDLPTVDAVRDIVEGGVSL